MSNWKDDTALGLIAYNLGKKVVEMYDSCGMPIPTTYTDPQGSPTPDVFQMGSSGGDVALGITQTPGFGIRVDNGVGAWDPTSGASLSQFSNYVQGLAFFAAPAIADVTGDGTPDLIVPADSGAIMGFDGSTGHHDHTQN